jgi:hypothetical protein
MESTIKEKGFRTRLTEAVRIVSDIPAAEELLVSFLVDVYCLAPGSGRGAEQDIQRIILKTDSAGDLPRHPESYRAEVDTGTVLIIGYDYPGLIFGVQTFIQLLLTHNKPGTRRDRTLTVPGVTISGGPAKPFRALRMFLPGRRDLPFFRSFIKHTASRFKYNRLILEMNGAMRLDSHPEVNAGWLEFGRSLIYSRRNRPEGPGRQFQDSAHHDTGDFGILEKEEVAALTEEARKWGLEVIPEIPALTHSYYLLSRHREFAEIQDAEWPDTYCPEIPEVYNLYFDVLDEYIRVMDPKVIHIGHDEWRMPVNIHPLTKGKNYGELYGQDVRRIHGYLAGRGIRTALWGDHLLEQIRSGEHAKRKSKSGYEYTVPPALTPEQVKRLIPKDILVFNWFWNRNGRGEPETNQELLRKWGFEQVYGNFTQEFGDQEYSRRSAAKEILGGAVSFWAGSSEINIAKNLLHGLICSSSLLWSSRRIPEHLEARTVQDYMDSFRLQVSEERYPGLEGERVTPVIPGGGNSGGSGPVFRQGRAGSGYTEFQLSGEPLEGDVVIDDDPSSILFLHCCERPGNNRPGYYAIHNFPDTADLLGWYEVRYSDGYTLPVPVRYGVNIREQDWRPEVPGEKSCPYAGPVLCSPEGTADRYCFAYEWKNPRFGKTVASCRLRQMTRFETPEGEPVEPNRVFLAGVSITRRRGIEQDGYREEDI